MVFQGDITVALSIIALCGGYGVLVVSKIYMTGKQELLGRIIAYLTLSLATFLIVCASYYSFKYWMDGAYESPQITQEHHSMRSASTAIRPHRMEKCTRGAEQIIKSESLDQCCQSKDTDS